MYLLRCSSLRKTSPMLTHRYFIRVRLVLHTHTHTYTCSSLSFQSNSLEFTFRATHTRLQNPDTETGITTYRYSYRTDRKSFSPDDRQFGRNDEPEKFTTSTLRPLFPALSPSEKRIAVAAPVIVARHINSAIKACFTAQTIPRFIGFHGVCRSRSAATSVRGKKEKKKTAMTDTDAKIDTRVRKKEA